MFQNKISISFIFKDNLELESYWPIVLVELKISEFHLQEPLNSNPFRQMVFDDGKKLNVTICILNLCFDSLWRRQELEIEACQHNNDMTETKER